MDFSHNSFTAAPFESPNTTSPAQTDTGRGSQLPPQVEPSLDADPATARLSALIRREKAIRARDAELKAKEQQFAAWSKEKEELTGKTSSVMERLKSDPFGLFLEQGHTYDSLTEKLLNQPSNDELRISRLEASLKQQLADTQTSVKDLLEKQQQSQVAALAKQISNEVKTAAENDPDFALIKAYSSHDDVAEYIQKVMDVEGRRLDLATAMRDVEATLEDEVRKAASVEKIKNLLNEQRPSQNAGGQGSQTTTQAPPRTQTLSNSQRPQRFGASSEAERRERAMRAFLGQN